MHQASRLQAQYLGRRSATTEAFLPRVVGHIVPTNLADPHTANRAAWPQLSITILYTFLFRGQLAQLVRAYRWVQIDTSCKEYLYTFVYPNFLESTDDAICA